MSRTVIIKNGIEITYDDHDKLIYAKHPDGFESWREYDSNGNEIYHSKESNGYEAWTEYDSHGNLIHTKHSNGYEQWHEYGSHGNRIHFKDSSGYEYWYDSDGKKISKEQFDKLYSK